MSQLELLGDYAPVCCLIWSVMFEDEKSIHSLVLIFIKLLLSISDRDLRTVLVGHDNCGLRKFWAFGIGVVNYHRLLLHTSMMETSLLVSFTIPGALLGRLLFPFLLCSYPSCLNKWELDGLVLILLSLDPWTGLDTSVPEVRRRLIHLHIPVLARIMQSTLYV